MHIKATMGYYLSHVSMAIIKEQKIASFGEHLGRMEHSLIVGRIVKWYISYVKHYVSSSEN